MEEGLNTKKGRREQPVPRSCLSLCSADPWLSLGTSLTVLVTFLTVSTRLLTKATSDRKGSFCLMV